MPQFGSVSTDVLGGLSFDDLSAQDASAVVECAREEHVAGLERIATSVGRPQREDPADGIARAWRWFLDRHPQPMVDDLSELWDSAARAQAPYWCWFRDGSGIFLPLGPQVCQDIDAVAAFVVASIVTANPGAAIVRSTAPANHDLHRKPVVSHPAGGEVRPVGQVVNLAHRVLRSDGPVDDSPQHFASIFSRLVVPWTVDDAKDDSESEAPVVGRSDVGDFDFEVVFSDVTAHERDADIDELVDMLLRHPGVSGAIRLDREVVAIRAAGLSEAELVEAVHRAWPAPRP